MLVKHVFSTMASQSSLFAYFSDRKKSQEEPVDSSDESERDIEENGSGKEIGEIDIVEPPSKKKSKRSFCKSWLDKFVWLRYDDVEEAMFCYYCKEAKKTNSYTSGCKNFRVTDVQKHAQSRDHRLAAEAYAMKKSGVTVTAAFTKIIDLREEAILAAMMNVYWLAKEDIASIKYNSLNELVKMQGCESIRNLFVGRNAQYSSPEVVKELQQAISQSIKNNIQKEIQNSPFYSIMLDESTDITTTKTLMVYAHVIVDGVRKTHFLADVQLYECTAVAITDVLEGVLKDYSLNPKKCIGFGSDGAKVMTGRENGVSALLKRKNPCMVSIHCVAHRLALASSQAAEGINVIVQYQKTLSAIYSHFSHSSVRTEHLAVVQQVLEEPEIKMKKLFEVRWLSFHNAVDAVLRSLTSLIVYFEDAAEKGDPAAAGIYRAISTYPFLALTHLLGDVLSILTKLSETFQREQLDISLIQPKVTAALDALRSMKSHNGPHLDAFTKAYDKGKYALNNIRDSPTQRSSFEDAKREFLSKLEQNLTDRFTDSVLLNAFKIINPKHFPSSIAKAANYGKEELSVIIQHFCQPTDSECESPLIGEELRSEFQIFCPFVIRNFLNTEFYKFAVVFLRDFADMYPQLAQLVSIALVLPVSSVPCERGFSAANRIKTKLRNRLQVTSVDMLLRIAIEGPPIDRFNFSHALEIYKSTRQHRIFSASTSKN